MIDYPPAGDQLADLDERLVGDVAWRALGAFSDDAGVTVINGAVAAVAGECRRTFGPSTCVTYALREQPPRDHRCETSRAIPHVCACAECGPPVRDPRFRGSTWR